ncbi:MAG: gentisate 1,2-dioxygenase [Alphaproteobacteria bacterium]|nr:gentisate 1,2-dioxygenase [Alphaproteobacteria bacterium]
MTKQEAGSALESAPERTPERTAYYKRMEGSNLAPLWEVLHGLVTKEPVSRAQPNLWKYDEVRPFVMEAGEMITAAEAERRVIILENPGLKGESKITQSLYAGLQLILPGEVAPAHRHAASALRFIIEGDGAFTAVDGEKTIMKEGDFVITPSWTWHDHGNDSNQPMVWMDGLDVPIVNLLETSFAENYEDEIFPLDRPDGDSLARYGAGVVPLGYVNKSETSPIFNYPYERTRGALEKMRELEEWDTCHGLKVQYVNPASGDFAMPTIATFMQLLPKGFRGTPYCSTDGTVYSVVEGRGRTVVGVQSLEWGKRDIFVIPSWSHHYHEADEDAVLFSFSDRPVQQKLGLWREQRGNDPIVGFPGA